MKDLKKLSPKAKAELSGLVMDELIDVTREQIDQIMATVDQAELRQDVIQAMKAKLLLGDDATALDLVDETAPVELPLRQAARRTVASLSVCGASPSTRLALASLMVSAMTDSGSLIAGVVEARARTYDHENILVLPGDQAKVEASKAKYQERMQREHPELRKLNRTPADEARLAAAQAKRDRKAGRR